MKTQKVTLNITVDTLDIDSAKAMLLSLLSNLDSGAEIGMLNMNDGDKITWSTSRSDVNI